MLNFLPTQSRKHIHCNACFTSFLSLLHPFSTGAVFRAKAPVKSRLEAVYEVFSINVGASPQLAGKTASECATCRNTTTIHDALGRELQKNLLFLDP
ncbi:MAG: hypothetical protein ACFB2X_26410 [Rivularia sp. (in: cyanobacteria)]